MSNTWRAIDDTATLGECEQVIVRAVWERFSSECHTIGTEVFGELCLDNKPDNLIGQDLAKEAWYLAKAKELRDK